MNQVIMRPKKPPRPKSEVFLDREDGPRRKRLSAFGGDSPYGRLDAYIKLEQLGEGSYATVFKGFSNLTKQVTNKRREKILGHFCLNWIFARLWL